MNYIYEINSFFDWIETNPISTAAMNLWHTLMNINNKCGWKKEFSVSRTFIEAKTGLKKDAYYAARKLLQEKGRIGFKEQGSQATIFWIIPFAEEKKNQSEIATTSISESPTDIPTPSKKISQTIIPTSDENPTSSQTENSTTNQTKTPTKSANILKQNNTKQMNDDEYIKVKDCYEQIFGMITPFIMEELSKWIEDLSSEIVIEALHRTAEKNKPWAYARKILKNWCKQNVRTLQDVQAIDDKYITPFTPQSMYKPFTKEELIF